VNDRLSKEDLRFLTGSRSNWCVSIYLPTHRAGPALDEDRIRLKNLLARAEEQLTDFMRAPAARQLLGPGRELVADNFFWRQQKDGLALFLGRDFFRYFRLAIHFNESLTVTGRYFTKPLLPLLSGGGRFFVLAFGREQVRLLEGTAFGMSEVYLEETPQEATEALWGRDPETARRHSSSPRKTGLRRAVFLGHSQAPSTNDTKEPLRSHFGRIDSALQEFFRDERAPLLLAGLEYAATIYREANTYGHLLDQLISGPDELSEDEIFARGWPLVEEYFLRAKEQAVNRCRQLLGTGLASAAAEEIVIAALNGRVGDLFVALELPCWGLLEAETATVLLHAREEENDFDLADVAAANAFLHGGTVYGMAAGEMPANGPLAATFRY